MTLPDQVHLLPLYTSIPDIFNNCLLVDLLCFNYDDLDGMLTAGVHARRWIRGYL
jgi:hypothetical protein